jgi:hypothetical protein
MFASWAVAAIGAGAGYLLWQSSDRALGKAVDQCKEQGRITGEKVRVRDKFRGVTAIIDAEDLVRYRYRYEVTTKPLRGVDIPAVGMVQFPPMSDDRIAAVVSAYLDSVCDGWEVRELERAGYVLSRVQHTVSHRQADAREREGWLLLAAVASVTIVLITSIPWGWYFVLAHRRGCGSGSRRQRERE